MDTKLSPNFKTFEVVDRYEEVLDLRAGIVYKIATQKIMPAKTATAPFLEVPQKIPDAVPAPTLSVVAKAPKEAPQLSVTTTYYLSIIDDVIAAAKENDDYQSYAIERGTEMLGLHQSLLKASVSQPDNERFKPYSTAALPGLIHEVAPQLQAGKLDLEALASARQRIAEVGI